VNSAIRALALVVLLGVAGTACGSKPTTRGGTEVVPGIQLRFGDEIRALDLAVEGDRIAHVVWSEQKRSADSRQFDAPRLLCRSKDLESGRWNATVALPGGESSPLRAIVAGNALHVIVGTHLRHLISVDRGATWTELDSLVKSGPASRTWDVVGSGDAVLLVSINPESVTGQFARADTLALWTARIGNSASEKPVRVATLHRPDFGDHVIRLFATPDSIYLFDGVPQGLATPGMALNTYRPGTRISVARSGDGGRTWSPLTEIKGLPDWGAPDGSIHDLAAAQGHGKIVAFYAGREVFAFESQSDGRWSAPAPACPASKGLFVSPSTVSSVCAASTEGAGVLLWIDTRFARTDRPFASPLSGQPDWSNNDVLMLPLSRFDGGDWRGRARDPQRLTHDLSYAERLRVRAGEHYVYALWSGLRVVGKHLDSFQSPPRLFFARLPMN